MSPKRDWHSSIVRIGRLHQFQVACRTDQSGPGGSSGFAAEGVAARSAVAISMIGIMLPTYREV
jgi:hypothetical protein